MLSADGTTRIADATAVSLTTKAAVRGYAAQAAREEGVAILQGTASVVQALGTLSRLMAMASYYDAFQGARSDSRDFRSIAPSLSLLRVLGPGRLVLGGGYRWFAFKPAPVLDFSGVTAAAAYRMNLGAPAIEGDEDNDAADWELAGSLTYEHRAFASNLCVKGEDCPPLVSRGLRQDTFTQVAIDVTRTASHLLGAGVAMQLNGSNSYGDGLMRGLAHVDATFLLPANLSLATRAELTWTRYDQSVPLRRDPVSGLPIASIEDEGRSTLRVEILRPLGERFHISARWIGYTNEIGGGPVRYRRQTVLLALGVSLDLL